MRDEEESIELRQVSKKSLDDSRDLDEAGEETVLEDGIEFEETDVHTGRGIKYYLICILMGSLMTAASKYAMKDTDQYVVMFFRMLGTFGISTLWMVYQRIDHLFWGPPGLRRILMARGFVGTLNLALLYFAVQFLPLPDYSLINFLTPLLTAIAAHFILGEPYHWVQAVASCVSFAGVVVVTRPSFIFGEHLELPEGVTPRQHTVAVFCVLLQVVGTTTIFLLLRTIGTRISPYTIVSHYALQTCILSAGILAAKAVAGSEKIQIPTKLSTWLVLLFIGIVGFTYQFLLSLAVARERASVLTQLDYMVLIYMMLWQFLFFDTLPDLVSVAGGVLIIAGVVWASHVRPTS